MLIEFQVENFRSLRERQVFSMVAATYSEHADTHTCDPKLLGYARDFGRVAHTPARRAADLG